MKMRFTTKKEVRVTRVDPDNYYLPMIETEGGDEWYLSRDSEEAGRVAREYWEDLQNDDPKEFNFIIGEENLKKWGLGEYAGPGLTKVTSLEEWFELTEENPQELWGSWGSREEEVHIDEELAEALEFTDAEPDEEGWRSVVGYLHNKNIRSKK